ncbi:MAG: thiamine-phosphate kinase [Oleiphilaceae bacterium]|nr:thiamine-phosphate kinase [Oleiphilaceae bacterium]
MGEFELISQFFRGIGPDSPDVQTSIGDDCAVVTPPAGMQLCCSLDTQVEGRHFPKGYDPDKVAWRALGAALSDLAAMGATPSHFTLSLAMPQADEGWLSGFSTGLKACAERFQVALIGGDVTRGPLNIAIQVHGWVPQGCAVHRSGATSGDRVWVSGCLGDARAALELLDRSSLNASQTALLERYDCPEPRLDLSADIRKHSTACLDISDGLVADARHLAEASGVCLKIDARLVPLSSQIKAEFPSEALWFALTGGDDYELVFTAPDNASSILKELGCHPIGTVVSSAKQGASVIIEHAPQELSAEQGGFQHFY